MCQCSVEANAIIFKKEFYIVCLSGHNGSTGNGDEIDEFKRHLEDRVNKIC